MLGVDGYTSRRQDGTTGYLFKNAHGDVVSAHSSTTNKIADYTYDAWGEQRTTGTQVWGASNPIRYNGQYYDTESGMTYLRARYYDSDIKRFISEDPAKDGLNWYAYANNNPVMRVDPLGLADVPENGVEILNTIIYNSVSIISCKVNYMQGDTKWAGSTADSRRTNLKNNISDIKKFSPKIANIIEDVIISNNGSIQQISSVIAVCVEMRQEIIIGDFKTGDEVIPEDKIDKKYNYYVNTGDIFLTSDYGYSAKEKILPNIKNETAGQHTFSGQSALLGYWVRVIFYDRYKQGIGDGFEHESNAKT